MPSVDHEPFYGAASMPTSGEAALSVAMTHPAPGVVLVRVIGEIDLVTVDRCRRVLCHACREATTCYQGDPDLGLVVCDLTAVTFLGAAATGMIAETNSFTRRHGARLRLVADTRAVRRVLQLTGLDREIPVDTRISDALAARPEQHT